MILREGGVAGGCAPLSNGGGAPVRKKILTLILKILTF